MSAVDLTTFIELADAGYNRIPIHRRVLADLETPLSIYLKLANAPWTYLFESVQGGEKWGRYSIIGLPCRERLSVTDGVVVLHRADGTQQPIETNDPLQSIADYQEGFRIPKVDGLPKFIGGLVGNFGYETIHYIEPQVRRERTDAERAARENPVAAPDIHLMLSEEFVVFDNLAGCLHLVVLVDPGNGTERAVVQTAYEAGTARIDALVAQLSEPACAPQTPLKKLNIGESDFVSNVPKETFMAGVDRAREYIRNGDVFQVVLSQRMQTPFVAHPLDLYRALRLLNPSPYMFYVNFDDYQIVGSSPEILVRLEDGEVTVRPLAGTRPRGHNEQEDSRLAAELLDDEKEIAEHVMLVDLGRNDVGRIAKIGTVKTTERFSIERYSHVMHIVSHVVGQLDPSMDAMSVIKATFPAGTLSGAPKVRAMQIIDEIEPSNRGVYSGAVGYIGWHGNVDTAIAIRTAVIADNTLIVQAGAGIVADSVPETEWQETLDKGRAVFKAAAMASLGLDAQVTTPVPIGAARQKAG